MSMSHNRWGSGVRSRNDPCGLISGSNTGKDFWTACATEPYHHSVNDPERRAVGLLAELCDRPRVNFYLSTGYLPAMGNKTKNIYMVKHQGGVLELDDGIGVATWCIGVGAHAWQGKLPATDNVIALKNLIEGEEGEFVRIGNRTAGLRIEYLDGSLGHHGESFLGSDVQVNGLKLQNKDLLGPSLIKDKFVGAVYYPAPAGCIEAPPGVDPHNPFPFLLAVREARVEERRRLLRMAPAELEALRGQIRERQRHHDNIAAEFGRHNQVQCEMALRDRQEHEVWI